MYFICMLVEYTERGTGTRNGTACEIILFDGLVQHLFTQYDLNDLIQAKIAAAKMCGVAPWIS